MSITAFIRLQREFSRRTFGEGQRTEGICRHIEKELSEIRADPNNCEEWVDVVLLALDGAWRAGHSPEAIEQAMGMKLAKNMRRRWPKGGGQNEPIEHVRKCPSCAAYKAHRTMRQKRATGAGK